MWQRRTFIGLAWVLWAAASPLWAETPASVRLDGRELWKIQTGMGGFPPKERAANISGNLINLASDTRRPLSDIRELQTAEEATLIVGRIYLFTVGAEEAALENKPIQALFAERKRIALAALQDYRESRQLTRVIQSAISGLGALLLAGILLILLRMAYRRLALALRAKLKHLTHAETIGPVYRVFERRLVLLTRLGLRLAFVSIGLTIVIGTLSFVLGLTPYTAGISHAIGGVLLGVIWNTGSAFVAYLPNLFLLILVALVALALIRTVRVIAQEIEAGAVTIPGFHADWASPTFDLVRILVILFALVVSFPYLPGGDSPALKGASLFIGVLVSLGSGSAMGNVISGVILTYMRPFLPGDRVSIAGTEGDIVERSLLVTRIRTIKNVEVIIPNHSILGTQIVNYSSHARTTGLILNTTITIGYDAPWRKVHELLIAAALDTQYILPSPKPFVFQTSLNDYHVSYQINAYTSEPNRKDDIYAELHGRIQDKFNEGGVEILSPAYTSLRDGNTVTIPESYRPADYVAGAFRVAGTDEGGKADPAGARSAGQV